MNFMGGLMQGASFVNGMQQQQRANDRADEQFSMQKEKFGMEKEDRANKQLLVDFDRETRALAEAGKAPDQGFWKKYSGLGIDKLESDEQREELMQAGTLMHRAVSENKWDERALDGINLMLKDDLAARTKTDGMARRIIGAKELPTGKDADGDGVEDVRMVPILEVTKSDGTKYTAPLTRNGTGDPDDDIYTINDQKINEWHEAALHRANMAYNLQRHKNDPKAFAAQLRNIVLGKQASDKPDYEYREGYDGKGNKTLYQIDKRTGASKQIGGAAAAKLSESERKASLVNMSDYMRESAKIASSTDFVSDDERMAAQARLDQAYTVQYGATPEQIRTAQYIKQQKGDYSPLTVQELSEVVAGMNSGTNKSSVGGYSLADATPSGPSQPQANTPAPPAPVSNEDQQLADLDAKSMDPSYPNNARDKFAKQAEAIRAAKVARNKPQAPPEPMSKSELFDRNMADLQSQLSNSTPEQAAAIVKKMADLATRNNNSSGASLADLASF